MEDISSIVFVAAFIASHMIDQFVAPTFRAKLLSCLLLLAGAVALWTGVYLPIGANLSNAIAWASGAAFIVFMIFYIPVIVRRAKATARD
ncbi:MAG: hypothetical protein PGN16_10170 [Sphingomonas phyllosphaerae]|uniref:hypothetical protein n=1 Tax=Sphingomonas phyllosphaerae TaxID=257003 RepID=UPI002FFD2985